MDAKTILMADNLQEFLNVRKEFLERAGYTVISASNPQDAEWNLAHGGFDLAILDIRLVDDDDPEDTSGLELARKFGQAVPIILLTGFPTWEFVKEALGPDLDGLSPAVDFLAKEEGPAVMVKSVGFALEHPRLKAKMLHEFQAESSQDLHGTLQKMEPAETSDRMINIRDSYERELSQRREAYFEQSVSSQKIAMRMGMVGIGVIVVGVFLAYLNVTPLAVVSGVAGVVSEAISVHFINRAVRASKQDNKMHDELLDSWHACHLLVMIGEIRNQDDRDCVRALLVQRLIEKWIGSGSVVQTRDGCE